MESVVVAYIPVVHAGYMDFLLRNPYNVQLLTSELVPGVSYLSRDIRALPASLIAKQIEQLWTHEGVGPLSARVANEEVLRQIAKKNIRIVMPDEDISIEAVERFFDLCTVVLDPVFLRWNWKNVEHQKPVQTDSVVSEEVFIAECMDEAFRLSKKSPDWWRQVGAVLVKKGKIYLTGYNIHFPNEYTNVILGDPRTLFTPGVRIDLSSAHHAEKQIISHAARLGISTNGADIFVTTFPCPSCAMDIVEAGIKRVYFCEGYSLLQAQEILESKKVEIVQVSRPPQN